MADENLHQFAYEDICITSTPSLYADVHFVYAATANGHTGEMPMKLLARASILQSQQDTFLIDPAGMQSEVIADRKITSPKRLRVRGPTHMLPCPPLHYFLDVDADIILGWLTPTC